VSSSPEVNFEGILAPRDPCNMRFSKMARHQQGAGVSAVAKDLVASPLRLLWVLTENRVPMPEWDLHRIVQNVCTKDRRFRSGAKVNAHMARSMAGRRDNGQSVIERIRITEHYCTPTLDDGQDAVVVYVF
jgi:hypothetical protein